MHVIIREILDGFVVVPADRKFCDKSLSGGSTHGLSRACGLSFKKQFVLIRTNNSKRNKPNTIAEYYAEIMAQSQQGKLWVVLLVAVFCTGKIYAAAFDPRDPVYDKVKAVWTGSDLDITIPPEMDCFAKCGNVDLCKFGENMLRCFDTSKDTRIDVEEMGAALKQLPLLDRAFAGSAQKWVDIFDGSDGTKKDQQVGFKEVLFSEGHCMDFYLGQNVFFKKCLSNQINQSTLK